MTRRLPAALLTLLTLLCASRFARADLSQPNGTIIPVGNSLQSLFTTRGESIDAIVDAFNVPETFIPSCALEFEVLQRNAGYQNSFGWYNVTGQKPLDSELHEFLACDAPIGTKQVLAIKQDPAYLGGEIAFYQAVGSCGSIANHLHIFYSQKEYNPDSGQANPYTHLLIYNSTVVPKAFYFGWEDLLSGGDNDFDDLTTFVTGISCAGGGGACQTGQLGICADGTMQCQSGQLTCVPISQPKDEKCNALDDDCNGQVDDGDLCPAGEVCDKGTCVPECGDGEFQCPSDKVCSDGFCVDPACAGVDCPSGEKCVAGVCQAPCDGVVCPVGQICLVGACLDPCAAITCDADQLCVAGACVEKCQCAGCGADESCQPTGACLTNVCVGVDCPTGQYCAADGTCQDACADAVCPAGEACALGSCVPAPGSGGAGGAGGGSTGNFVGAGGGPPGAGAGGGTAAGGASPADPGTVIEGKGCGCRVGDARGSDARFAAVALAVAIATARRRRRRAG